MGISIAHPLALGTAAIEWLTCSVALLLQTQDSRIVIRGAKHAILSDLILAGHEAWSEAPVGQGR